jgi:hypothetical protein
MGGKSSRTKGHNFERLVARTLRFSFPDARRGKQYTGGREADVEGTPFRIECKRLKTVRIGDVIRALTQAEADAHTWKDVRPCVAIHKEDRGNVYVTMKLSTAATIVERFFYSQPELADVIPFPTKDEA